MRRPIRTHRLSIAAMLSLLLFGTVAGAGVRSFWIMDGWGDNGRLVALSSGCIFYTKVSQPRFVPSGYFYTDVTPTTRFLGNAIWGFTAAKSFAQDPSNPSGKVQVITAAAPIGPLLLLLLIVPALWLIARSANAPAFPVITDAKQP